VIGIPTLLANGNFEVDYQVVAENNRDVDLVDVSLVNDLTTQFGPGVIKRVRNLTMVAPPTNSDSSITLNVSGWDGTSESNIIARSLKTNRLASGDSFVIAFKVEIDGSAATSVLHNTATAKGTAVDSAGVSFIDATAKWITASDDSGSGTDRSVLSSGEPTPIAVPSIGLSKTPGDAVENGDNWDVTFTIAWKNTGTVALDKVEIYDDLAAMFGGQFAGVTLNRLIAGSGNTGSAPIANPSFAFDTTNSLITCNGPLHVGDAFEVGLIAKQLHLDERSTRMLIRSPNRMGRLLLPTRKVEMRTSNLTEPLRAIQRQL